MDRRRLLKSIAASGALAKWPALAAAANAADESRNTYAVFSPSQAALMESFVDQLVPADDFPGATDAGVVHYIDQKLAGSYGQFFVGRYEAGLKLVEEISRQNFQLGFVSLDADQRSTLLHAMEAKTYGDDARDFFQTVLSDTFAGYYGNPRDGANRNGASWKMIGFKG